MDDVEGRNLLGFFLGLFVTDYWLLWLYPVLAFRVALQRNTSSRKDGRGLLHSLATHARCKTWLEVPSSILMTTFGALGVLFIIFGLSVLNGLLIGLFSLVIEGLLDVNFYVRDIITVSLVTGILVFIGMLGDLRSVEGEEPS